MDWTYSNYFLPYFVSAAVSGALGVYGWRRRAMPGGASFAVLAAAVALTAVSNAMELGCADLRDKLFWANVEYTTMAAAPVSWFAFAAAASGRHGLARLRYVLLASVVPAVTVALAWTNEWHELLRRNVALDAGGPFSVVSKSYGPWFWVYIAHNYALIFAGTALILHMLATARHLYRKQAAVLLIGVLTPWVLNAMYVFRLGPLPRMDLTTVAFTVTGAVVAWGLLQFRLLDLVPVARDAVIEGLSDGVIVLDARGRVADLNPAAQEIIGHPAPHAIGRRLAELWPQAWPEPPASPAAEIAAGERSYDCKVAAIAGRRGAPTGSIVVLRDVTERKLMQDRLAQSEKLLAMGQLTSGMAHELNNPLTSVIGFAQLLLRSPALDEAARRQVEVIEKEGDRARRIVQNLLNFSRQSRPHRFPIDIREVLNQALALRAHQMGARRIAVERRDGDIPQVFADPNQLERVFVNIILNAEKAMEGTGGVLAVQTAERVEGEARQVEIIFADSGPGIAPGHLRRIFDPFFTTRPVGQGAGLGLSVSYGLIEENGGRIDVESAPGAGARFIIRLPAHGAPARRREEIDGRVIALGAKC